MLTTADYRAAVLGAYRRYRALGEQPRVAYRLATAVTAPLPVGRRALVVADALRELPAWAGSNLDLPPARRARLHWRLCYRMARYAVTGAALGYYD